MEEDMFLLTPIFKKVEKYINFKSAEVRARDVIDYKQGIASWSKAPYFKKTEILNAYEPNNQA